MFLEIMHELAVTYLHLPWYFMIWFGVGVIFTCIVIFFLLLFFPEVTKALYAMDVIGFWFFVYCGVTEGFDLNAIVVLILLAIGSVVLLFLSVGEDPDDLGLFGFIFFTFVEGLMNCCIIAACFTIVLLPLGMAMLGRNDRYSNPSDSGW